MNNRIIKYKYLIVFMLIIVSFLTTHMLIKQINNSKYSGGEAHDSLSKKSYDTGGIYNYKENNPYGSYFVGFDQLIDRGVRNEEWIYMSDTLTNFTMYNQKIYNGKISYVKDSFTRDSPSSGSFITYTYKFGINNGAIHTMKAQSSWVQEIIRISILDNSGKVLFFREFKINPQS